LLQDLGPADPPAGLVENVMARIALDTRNQATGRVVPFNKGGIAMTRKAMWGIAAAAAVLLGVFAVRGFPPVGRGTEGTVGAAKKYQAPQIAAKDVVLGDAVAQEFLQSEAFDHLMKDRDARSLLSSGVLNSYLKDPRFIDAIRNPSVRDALASQAVVEVFATVDARGALEAQIKAQMAGAGVKQASADELRPAARAMVARLLSDQAIASVMRLDVVRAALDDGAFRSLMSSPGAAAAMKGNVLAAAVAQQGFKAAVLSGKLESSLR
jgi:citrate lyase gamma subunit